MKHLFSALCVGVLVSVVGCDRGTSGGPGATSPPSKANIINQSDDTFSLSVPAAELYQGETETVSVEISRGTNFGQDVSLKLGELPQGVTMDPVNPIIKHGDDAVSFTLRAADDAALGDFTVSVTGKPALGSEAVSELKVAIAKPDPEHTAEAAADAAKAMRAEYLDQTQKQLDAFVAQHAQMKDRVAKVEGPSRTELDTKCADVESKMDAAAAKLEELKSASADQWENLKRELQTAFDDLKNALT